MPPLPRPLLQQSDSVGLVVISEGDNRTLLIHRIVQDNTYLRQGGALLSLPLLPPAAACPPATQPF